MKKDKQQEDIKLIKVSKAAEMLGMATQTIYNQIYISKMTHGYTLLWDKIKVYRVGSNSIRFNKADIEKYIESSEI